MDEVADSNSVAPTMLRLKLVSDEACPGVSESRRTPQASWNYARASHYTKVALKSATAYTLQGGKLTLPLTMRRIKALIYALLGGMVAWGYWQRDSFGLAIFIALFTLMIMTLTLSSIGRIKISWNDEGIILAAFPKKPKHIRWEDLEKVTLDHLGYHVEASSGRFKIRKKVMPENLLRRIKENIRINKEQKS